MWYWSVAILFWQLSIDHIVNGQCKRCGFAKTRLRHPSLPFDSLPYPTRTICRRVRTYVRIQGGKTFCANFCASFIAGSRRAFLCVDCVRQFVCLSLREFWLRVSEMQKVWTFASRKRKDGPSVWGGIKSLNISKEGSIFLIVHSIDLWVDFAFFRHAELKPAFFH